MDPQDPEFAPLITSHLAYARSLAFQAHQKLPSFVEFPELVARAYLGLVQAARRFEPKGEHASIPFIVYAQHRIRGELSELTRRKNLQHLSTGQLSDDPEAANAVRSLQGTDSIPEEIDRAKRQRLLLEAIQEVDPESQVILKLLCADWTGEECAQLLGVSEATISQRRRRAYAEIRESNAGKRLKEMIMPKTTTEQDHRAEVIDELGSLEKELTEQKTWMKLKRIDTLRDEARAWIPQDLEPSKEAVFQGKKFTLKVLPRRDERSVKPGGYKKILAWLNDLFFEQCHMTIKALEVLLTAEQQTEVLEKGPTGARWVRTEPISKSKIKAA